jgi:sugar/nucleoside kinase (ribokinase family)
LPILCAGAALWDIIARAGAPLHSGADVPGRIERRMGGVALNVALALAGHGARPALLTALGRDSQGDRLVAALEARGVDCAHVTRTGDPTDTYLAVEDAEGELFAAVADCAGLERAGEAVLAPLRDGRLGDAARPWPGTLVIDGNLPEAVLAGLAGDPAFAAARLAFVPASPGKAARLGCALGLGRAVLYVNRREAEVITGEEFPDAAAAAEALVARGAARAVVTDGGRMACAAGPEGAVRLTPPPVAGGVTGAGDAFLAAHLAAEARGLGPGAALEAAVGAAAQHISRAS